MRADITDITVALALSTVALLAIVVVSYVLLAYQVGTFHRNAVAALFDAVNRAIAGESREWTVEEVRRYADLKQLHRRLMAERSDPRLSDRAITNLLGCADDERELTVLERRRDELHAEALQRILDRARGADAATILRRGQRWLLGETIRLAWLAVREIGPRVWETFAERALRVLPRAALVMAGAVFVAWPVAALLQRGSARSGDALALAPELGAGAGLLVGIGYVLIGMHRGALSPALDAMPAGAARRSRRIVLAGFALAALMFLAAYRGWIETTQRWTAAQVPQIPREAGFVIVLIGANWLFGSVMRQAWTVWRARGVIVAWQRVESLGAVIFAASMLLVFDGLGPLLLAEVRGDALISLFAYVVFSLFVASIALSYVAKWMRRRARGAVTSASAT